MSTSRSMSRDPSERAAERVVAAQGTLASEIAALQSGEDWQRFLDLQSRLHSYSSEQLPAHSGPTRHGLRGRSG